MPSLGQLLCLTLCVSCGRVGFGEQRLWQDASVDAAIDAGPNLEFGIGERITELSAVGVTDDDSTLTSDMTEIYFASGRAGGTGSADIYRATRSSPTGNWMAPQEVSVLSTPSGESTLAVSANGLFLLFCSSADDPFNDVYLASRTTRQDEFGVPVRLTSVNSAATDSASWISDDGLTIWIHSDRNANGVQSDFDIYESTRLDLGASFSTPVRIASLSTAPAAEISATLHERFALLAINEGDGYDLFIAPRTSDSGFDPPLRLRGPNTDANETDAWLSPDGCSLFFARDVDGSEQLFEASCLAP